MFLSGPGRPLPGAPRSALGRQPLDDRLDVLHAQLREAGLALEDLEGAQEQSLDALPGSARAARDFLDEGAAILRLPRLEDGQDELLARRVERVEAALGDARFPGDVVHDEEADAGGVRGCACPRR